MTKINTLRKASSSNDDFLKYLSRFFRLMRMDLLDLIGRKFVSVFRIIKNSSSSSFMRSYVITPKKG